MKKTQLSALLFALFFSSFLYTANATPYNAPSFEDQWNKINNPFNFPWDDEWAASKEDNATKATASSFALEDIVGAVYAMTNGDGQIDGNVQGPNSIVAYGQAADGTLMEMGSFATGGNGGDLSLIHI